LIGDVHSKPQGIEIKVYSRDYLNDFKDIVENISKKTDREINLTLESEDSQEEEYTFGYF